MLHFHSSHRPITAANGSIRILVITGGHDYKVEEFNQMLAGLGENITYQVAELPAAYDMFLPENRNKYDVSGVLPYVADNY